MGGPRLPYIAGVSKGAAAWRPMTGMERRGCAALGAGVVYPVGSFWKRLARSLVAQANVGGEIGPQITDRQAELMWRTVQRFRRQIEDKELVKEAELVMRASG